jgi:hypothetical protein
MSTIPLTERPHRILKFPFDIQGEFTILMPQQSALLSVQYQNQTPCIWAMCPDGLPGELRHFRIFGTGHVFILGIFREWHYLSTIQDPSHQLVWHIFEVKLREEEKTPA